MERDDGEPSAATEKTDGLREGGSEGAELVIDRDAESLEGAGGGMNATGTADGAGDQIGQLGGGAEGRQLTGSDDGLGNAAGTRLFTKLAEGALDGFGGGGGEELGGALTLLGIEAHIQRALGAESEAALRRSELIGGEAEIQQDAIRRIEARPLS